MDKNRCLKLVLLATTFSVLVACNRGVRLPPGEERPSAHGDQGSVSAIGSWRGTLTTTAGGSGTQLFTAEITELDA